MRRLVPLLGAVLTLALSGTAAADTFRIVQPPAAKKGGVSFTQTPVGPMTFAALRPIWQAAGNAYGIPWQVLAAINKVETGFGANLGPSSAGAVGWMQFMPSTWARWGIDANGDGVADPNNPTDAIFSAARYLAGCGGQTDITRAVYCYNHSNWYVEEVMGLAALYGQGGDPGLFSLGQLQASLHTARREIATSHAQLGVANSQARKLRDSEERFLRVANTARLLSDQLEAHKHAVLVGVRRRAADARAARLRKRLDAATAQLGRMKAEAGATSFASTNPQFLAGNVFSVGNGPLQGSGYGGVVSIAMRYLGVPYLWGGETPNGFDCSGLVSYVYAQVGVSLPHYTVSQWNYSGAVSVPPDQLQPGDLVFFNGLDHVGIYVGYGYFIDAPHTGASVRIDRLSEPWYAANYDGARRIVGANVASLPQTTDTVAFAPSSGSNTTSFTSDVVYFTH